MLPGNIPNIQTPMMKPLGPNETTKNVVNDQNSSLIFSPEHPFVNALIP
jgi:hypothetical protein